KLSDILLFSPCLAYSPDGKVLAANGAFVFRLSDTQTHAERAILRGHGLDVWSMEFSPDGKRLYSVDQRGMVRLWQAEPAPALVTLHDGLKRHSGLQGLAFRSDNRTIATAGG